MTEGAEEKSFEQLMEEANTQPNPGDIGDPDLGLPGDMEPPPLAEEDEPTQVNDDDEE